MILLRNLAMAAATLAIALAAGHYVQNSGRDDARSAVVVADTAPVLRSITPVSAGPDTAVGLPQIPVAPVFPNAAVLPDLGRDFPRQIRLPSEPRGTAPLASGEVSAACPVSLHLTPEADAMISVTLAAPCQPEARVVLRHAGLAVAERTNADGSLFVLVPALDELARVTILFADGNRVEGMVEMPEVAGVRRFGVQWTDKDRFQLHAFEGGADYGTPGHISAAANATGGGYVTAVGNPLAEPPMLAEVYTFPADPDIAVNVVVEALVTDQTCARDLLGETFGTRAGAIFVNELTVTMPGCEAVGDYVVLKNLLPDMTIVAAH